jgi:thiamine-monophosphate kinase
VAELEQRLIERYFTGRGARRGDVALGIGDDAAVLDVRRGAQLIVTTDALIEGVHFIAGAPPRSLGHRALAVNLSDIAAMGAEPAWMLLALVLPRIDHGWLRDFSGALDRLARRERVALVGGNLSRGPLSITITLAGVVERGQALRRDGARAGDELYCSGTLGEAAAGLELLRTGRRHVTSAAARRLRRRFEYPEPRVALGRALRGIASACIDVSDGLYVDASRLLHASGVAAELELQALPLSQALRQQFGALAPRLALAGGEDYELCFTAPRRQRAALARLSRRLGVPITRLGTLYRGAGLRLHSADGKSVTQFSAALFDHFGHWPRASARGRQR